MRPTLTGQSPSSFHAISCENGVSPGHVGVVGERAGVMSHKVLGLLQYVSPTLQLLLGVWLYNEPFAGPKVAGYVLIWAGLAVYSAESWMQLRRRTPLPA